MTTKTIKEKIKQLQTNIEELLEDREVAHGFGRVLRLLNKELSLYQNHTEGLLEWENKKATFNFQKIQIGGGKHTLKGFLNIDIDSPADLICDVREGIPLNDSSVEFIFNEHFFEHVDYPNSAKKVVSEFYRVLKPDGQIVLGVPDGELAIKSYVTRDKEYYEKALTTWYANRNCLEHFNTYIDLLNYNFRDQDDDEKYNPHYWAYDFEKIESLLKNVGFKKVEKWKFNPEMANPKREWGSIYVIATK